MRRPGFSASNAPGSRENLKGYLACGLLCANSWQTHAAMSLVSRYELRSRVRRPTWRQFLFLCIFGTFATAGMANFINFETAPVHPIALSPDARALALCNLPDGRVELFDVSTGTPVS